MSHDQMIDRELRREYRSTRRPLVVKSVGNLYRVYVYHDATDSHIWLYTLPYEAAYRVANHQVL